MKEVMTRGIAHWLEAGTEIENIKRFLFFSESLVRFKRQDWGDTSEEDKKLNDADPGDALASYTYDDGTVIWIKADAGEVTTVLFPDEW